jgi:hypothetical protein
LDCTFLVRYYANDNFRGNIPYLHLIGAKNVCTVLHCFLHHVCATGGAEANRFSVRLAWKLLSLSGISDVFSGTNARMARLLPQLMQSYTECQAHCTVMQIK